MGYAERMVKQMRLIDADALSERLCKTTIFVKDGEVFQRMINDAPTVSAEAVQVVRCKDCKNRARYSVCDFLGEDGFCSHGECREDGEA